MTVPPSVETALLNSDALPDYLLDYSAFHCSARGGHNMYCGQLGCAVDLWVSGAGGWRRAALISTPAWEVDRSTNPNRFFTLPEGPGGKRMLWAWNPEKGAFTTTSEVRPTPAAASKPAAGTGFSVNVELTPSAQAWYHKRKDRPVLLVIYQGEPKRGAPEAVVDPVEGLVVAGEERILLPAAGGTVRVPGAGIDRQLLRWIQGEPEVGLLVGHALPPKSSMDSERYLECTPDTNPKLSVIRAKGLKLRCGPPAW